MFGRAVACARCGERSFVRMGRDVDANHFGILTMIASNPGRQACAGTKHGDIGGEHVPDEFLDARFACCGGQMLNEQRADAVALPSVVDKKRDLSLRAVLDVI